MIMFREASEEVYLQVGELSSRGTIEGGLVKMVFAD